MGKKKDKAKKLAAREAEIRAELNRRAEKAAKKTKKRLAAEKAEPKKKAGKKKAAKAEPVEKIDGAALGVMTIEAEAPIVAVASDEPAPVVVTADDPAIVYAKSVIADLGKGDDRHPHLAHLDRVGKLIEKSKGEGNKAKKARVELAALRAEGAARIAERDAATAAADAELAKKVKAKKAEREKISKADRRAALEDEALGIDRADAEAVRAYNAEAVKVGATLLTSDAEREKIAERQTVEEVETETGRVFEAGEAKPDVDFAKPSEAPPVLEEGRNGYKIIQLDESGKPNPRKERQLTRVTTFVGNIDDETTLKKWDKRMVAEGLAADASSPDPEGEAPLIVRISDIAHRRDTKIAKARRADRKGKLGVGEVGAIVAAAEKEAKDALDAIVEQAAARAGRNDKANFGTHLHTLAEISDANGIDAVREIHEAGLLVPHDNDGKDGLEPMPVTATDVASIEAYAARMARLGAKVIHSEAVVVNDEMGYAGRLDRIIMCKLPELVVGRGTPGEYVRPADQRACRYVADIKSGRVDLGGGKIGRQLAAYALGDLYDLETGERSRHSAKRDIALVFHLPQGAGTCAVYPVDLKAGTALLKLSAEVRRGRNTGRKVLDTTVDIADPAPEGEAE